MEYSALKKAYEAYLLLERGFAENTRTCLSLIHISEPTRP